MLISYARSSSIANWSYCSHQYFITYVLGKPHKAGLKALKGTCTHAVLEALARAKLAVQNNEDEFRIAEYDGVIPIDTNTWLEPHFLTAEEIAAFNRTRINKSTYKHPCQLKKGHVMYGVDFVEDLIAKCCDYYSDPVKHGFEWKKVDRNDVANWVWMALDYNKGTFDPRRREIVDPERHFDIEIKQPWAKYDWTVRGKKVSGHLGVKGTIDLITQVDEDTLEIIDWKTGQRLDWATGEEKTYKKLQTDFQLMLYHYVVKKLFPKVKTVFVTIFFVRDGGPFTLCFDDLTVEHTEAILQQKFEEIKAAKTTKKITPEDFRCTKLCDFYKQGSPIAGKNYCQYVYDMIREVGIEKTTELLMEEGFNIGHYEAP